MTELYFRKLVEDGSHFNIGKARGEWAAGFPELYDIYAKPSDGEAPLLKEEANYCRKAMEKYVPWLLEELDGFAAGIGIPFRLWTLYALLSATENSS